MKASGSLCQPPRLQTAAQQGGQGALSAGRPQDAVRSPPMEGASAEADLRRGQPFDSGRPLRKSASALAPSIGGPRDRLISGLRPSRRARSLP
ncbi:unnamed protein product [Lampetra fluviatilis]